MTTTRATFFMLSSSFHVTWGTARRRPPTDSISWARSRGGALVAGRTAELVAIRGREMRRRAEAARDADVRDRHGGLRQQCACPLEPPALPERRGCLAEVSLEESLDLARR